MDLLLNEEEVRVLGCLLEKEMATPDYYPLSLNSLATACNQKTNRHPVVSYGEETIFAALDSLKEKALVWQSDAARVAKFSENFVKMFKLINREAAVLCILMLRGPQTPGELRGRTERLHLFETLEAVAEPLESLIEMGFARKLPRQPGCKESRYGHLLAGEPVSSEEFSAGPEAVSTGGEPVKSRMAVLEEELAELRREVDALRREFLDFKGQF